jgi:hypothetical protein
LRAISDLALRLAPARVHPDVRRRFYELYLLFPFDRQNAWIPSCRNTTAYSAAIFPGVSVLTLELMALWTYWRALLSYRGSLRHLRCWPDHFHDDVRHRASLLRYVFAGYGFVLRLPGYSAVGFFNYCTAEIEAGGDARTGDSCV